MTTVHEVRRPHTLFGITCQHVLELEKHQEATPSLYLFAILQTPSLPLVSLFKKENQELQGTQGRRGDYV